LSDYVLSESPGPAGRIITVHHQRNNTVGQSRTQGHHAGRPFRQGGTMIRLPGRRLRYMLLVAGSAAAFLLAVPVTAANAAPVANLNCTITVTTDVHPGVTAQLRHFASTSHGLTGTATCTGTVNGQPVTGPGRFLDNIRGIGNCTQANGTANFVLKIPTASGTQTVEGHYAFAFPTSVGTRLSGDITGTAVVVSSVGDCVTTPLTRTTSVLTGHVT
jgi:hypothetical protein